MPNLHNGKSIFITLMFFILSTVNAATFTVINTNDTGAGSLRAAMTAANTTPGADIINFNIPGTGVQTIFPLSQLPPLVDTAGVLIDGLTQPGAAVGGNPPSTCVLMIQVNGINAGASHGFWILSPNNSIQGLVVNNFEQHGIRIQGTPNGTYNNLIIYNWVGVDPSGTVIQGNGWNTARFWGGIYIEVVGDSIGFAFDNHIEFNLSSGNYAEGVGISNCPPGDVYQNFVIGNYIGTDFGGTADLGNVHDGVYIGEGAHDNVVDGNLISGNDFEGVCIVGYPPYGWNSHSNLIFNNIIGLDIGLAPLANTMDGVSIGQYGNIYQGGYATGNIVDSNTIAHNGNDGVCVWEHQNNTVNCDDNMITRNSIYSNGGLGIDLDDDNVTPNDAGDPDTGANEDVNFPYNMAARYFTGQTIIDGYVDIDTDPTQATVEVFQALADPTNYGEGQIYLGSTTPNASSYWTITVSNLNIGDDVTATTTDMNMNTSEFAQNIAVILGIDEHTNDRIPDQTLLTVSPNPFRKQCVLKIQEPRPKSQIELKVFDAAGRRVKSFNLGDLPKSVSSVRWDGRDDQNQQLPGGVYFLQLKSDQTQQTRALIKLE